MRLWSYDAHMEEPTGRNASRALGLGDAAASAGVRCTSAPASLANGDEARGAATGHVLDREVCRSGALHRRRDAAVGGASLARGRLHARQLRRDAAGGELGEQRPGDAADLEKLG